jgi:hypothetical protein
MKLKLISELKIRIYSEASLAASHMLYAAELEKLSSILSYEHNLLTY